MNDEAASGQTPGASNGQARPTRRRWLRGLVILAAVLAVLVAAAPYVISTGPVLRGILGMVNDRIYGRIEVEGVSLGWLSATEVRGLRVRDRADREVLRVERVRLAHAAWRAALSAERFGQLDVDSPHVVLYTDPSGGVSLVEALSLREPAPKDPDEPAAQPSGRVVIRNASVRVVRLDGRELTAELPQCELAVDTLDDLDVAATVRLAGGGLRAEARLGGLAAGDEASPAEPAGTVRLSTDERIDLGALSRFALTGARVAGSLALNADVALGTGSVRGEVDANVAGLRAGRGDDDEVRPIDVRLRAKAFVAGSTAHGTFGVESPCGGIDGRFVYAAADAPPDLSAERVLAAVLSGESLALPKFQLDANGQVDLPRLAAAVPALLRVRPGVAVTAGKLAMTGVSLRGGREPGARGGLTLTDFAARRGDRAIRWQPVSVTWDAGIAAAEGLHVRDAHVVAGFGELTARGTPAELTGEYTFDLAALMQQLAEVFEVGDVALAGSLRGRVGLTGVRRQGVTARLSTTVESLSLRQGDRRLAVGKLAFAANGSLERTDANEVEVVVGEARVDADDELALTAAGRANLSRGSLDANVVIRRGVLAGLAQKAKGLGVEAPEGLTGALAGRASLKRAADGSPVASDGELAVRGLHVEGEPIGEQPLRVTWSGAELSGDANTARLARATLTSDLATASLTDVAAELGESFGLVGRAEVSADLARCVALGRQFAEPNALPDLAGQLTWRGVAGSGASGTTVAGEGGVADLAVGRGDQVVRPKRVGFKHAVRIDPAGETIHVERFRLDSDLLEAHAAGTIAKYKTDQLLDITGGYKGSWKELTRLLEQFAPDANEVVVTGSTGGAFRLTGTASRPELRPAFRELAASTAVGWESVHVWGFDLGDANVPVSLEAGRVVVASTEVAASGGTARLGGTVDLAPNEPVLELPGRVAVLENVRVNREVGEKLLSRFNPIFGQLAALEGNMTLTTQDLRLPLGEGLKTSGAGSGHIDLSRMRVMPGGLTAKLLDLGGLGGESTHLMEVSGLDFAIRAGGIHYDNFAVTFDGTLDLRFRGVVRFDDELDMIVSVPVRAALLRKFGVRGRVDEYARLLEGSRVDVPLVGSRSLPMLDFSKVDVEPLVKKAIEALMTKEAGNVLGDLLKRRTRPGDEPTTQPTTQPTTRPKPKTPQETIIRDIFNLFGDKKKPKKN